MGRVRRVDVGGRVYHVLNRANFRSRLFRSPTHYQAFLGIVKERLLKWLSHSPEKEEKITICELLLDGARLLNSIPSYDYKKSGKREPAEIVEKFCDLLLRENTS